METKQPLIVRKKSKDREVELKTKVEDMHLYTKDEDSNQNIQPLPSTKITKANKPSKKRAVESDEEAEMQIDLKEEKEEIRPPTSSKT